MTTLDEVCLNITDGSHTSPRSVDHGYYMASVKDMGEYGFCFENCRMISKEDYIKLVKNGCQPHYGDVLIGKDGARYLEDAFVFKQDEKVVLLSSIAILRPDKTKITPEYLYYFLTNKNTRIDIKNNYGSGSAIPRMVLKDFKRVPILLPSIAEQQAIAATLSCLDDKIELNNRINKNLEEMAQAIFKSWFVDFEPFQAGEFVDSEMGKIPKGWRVGALGECIDIFDSKRIALSNRQREAMQKKYPYYGAASLMDYVDDFIFDGVYVLLGEDGTVVDDNGYPNLQYIWGKFWVNNHAHILKGNNGFNEDSLYMLLKNTSVQGIVTGAVQPKINQANLKSLKVLIPTNERISEYNNLLEPIFAEKRRGYEENRALTSIREALLPKLMSGEIRVPLEEVQ
jgi:type I restriction enzyme S subunit